MLEYLLAFLTIERIMEFILRALASLVGVLGAATIVWFTWFRERWKFNSGDMTDLIQVTANYFDHRAGGEGIMKPRVVVKPTPIREFFPNPELARLVAIAAQKCDCDDPQKKFVIFDDSLQQEALRKAVVAACSELTGVGHLRRMFDDDAVESREGCISITVAREGNFKLIRIDMVDRERLRKFLDPEYRKSLRALDRQQSHDDMAEVFEIMAGDVFDPNDPSVRRSSDRAHRVSMQFLK